MLNQDDFFADPYVFVGNLYSQAYIGGWNAAERLGLLDESTRNITLFSPEKISQKDIYGVNLQVQNMPKNLFFGTESVVTPFGEYVSSDLEKTIVDLALYPDMFGDKENRTSILKNYLQRDDKDLKKLQNYFQKSGRPELMVRLMKEAL
ncbi:MAG: hypothetical protein J6P93_05025 [Alphaproteobacteria bacterium]|nr:hypothetical protein [Alphaproteobacteria bacterium]